MINVLFRVFHHDKNLEEKKVTGFCSSTNSHLVDVNSNTVGRRGHVSGNAGMCKAIGSGRDCAQLRRRFLCITAKAAPANSHRLHGLYNRNRFSHNSEVQDQGVGSVGFF